jgi:hypothetical protein
VCHPGNQAGAKETEMAKIEIVNTSKLHMMHDASRPFAVVLRETDGHISKTFSRHATMMQAYAAKKRVVRRFHGI